MRGVEPNCVSKDETRIHTLVPFNTLDRLNERVLTIVRTRGKGDQMQKEKGIASCRKDLH
jgi:hypothetical protein